MLLSHPNPQSTIHNPQSPRLWRIAFIAYLVLLTTATHWPRLALGPEVPVNDKEIHIAVFATFTFLLWRTRWIANLGLVALVALLWAGLDESSQAIPAVHRTACWPDYFANAAGVLGMTAALWMWTLIRRRAD